MEIQIQKVKKLIDEAYNAFKEIGKNFYGSERILTNEKEERFYRTKFKELEINPNIVSEIYAEVKLGMGRGGIEELKSSIETRLRKK